MYIVTCNTAHKDTVTIFGTFKTIFGAKGFLKEYSEKVKAYKEDPLYKKYKELTAEIQSESFQTTRARFPHDRAVATKLYDQAKLEKAVRKLAHLHGIEIKDSNYTPFEFTDDSTDYIYKINYPINISTKLEENKW